MSSTTPENQQPAQATEGEKPEMTVHDFENILRDFWTKNGTAILVLCTAVLLAIVGREGYGMYRKHQDEVTGKAYQAANTPEKLRSFIAANDGHSLAGLAQLRLAGDSYKAGKYAEAELDFAKAEKALVNTPFIGSAKLGAAMCKVLGSKSAEGVEALKKLSADLTMLKSVRTEAAFHLATIAFEARNAEEFTKYADQIDQIEPGSPWSQRTMMMRSALPAPAAPAAVAPVEIKKP